MSLILFHPTMEGTHSTELDDCDTIKDIIYLADIYKEPRNFILGKLFCRVRFLQEVYLSWACPACGLRVARGFCPLKCKSTYIFKASASCVITDGTSRAYLYLDNEHLVMSLLRVSQDSWNRMKILLKISGNVIYRGRGDDEAKHVFQSCPLSEQGKLLLLWCHNPKVCEHMTLFARVIHTRDTSSFPPREVDQAFKGFNMSESNDTWKRNMPSLRAIQVNSLPLISEAHRLAKDLEKFLL